MSLTKTDVQTMMRLLAAGSKVEDAAAILKRDVGVLETKLVALARTRLGNGVAVETLRVAGFPEASLAAARAELSARSATSEMLAAELPPATLRISRTFAVYRDEFVAAGGDWTALTNYTDSDIVSLLACHVPAEQRHPEVRKVPVATAQPLAEQTAAQPAALPAAQQPVVESVSVPASSEEIENWAEDEPEYDATPAPTQAHVSAQAHVPAGWSEPKLTYASSVLGAAAEASVESALREKFAVRRVAASARSGDLLIERGGRKIMVEVKRYATAVPSAEVAKFHRDIEAHSEVHAALFISRSRITGVADAVHIAEVDGRPCMYVADASPAVYVPLALALDGLVAARQVADRDLRLHADSVSTAVLRLRDISDAVGELSMTRALLADMQRNLHDGCMRVAASILGAEARLAAQLAAALDALHGIAADVPVPCEDVAAQLHIELAKILPRPHAAGMQIAAALSQLARLPGAALSCTATSAVLTWPSGRLEIVPRKTRTNFRWHPAQVGKIPQWCEYSRGVLSGMIDMAFIASHLDELCSLIA